MTGKHVRVRVRLDPIDCGELMAFVASPSAGASVLFIGTVRDHSEGRTGVTHLEYEAYAERVEGVIMTIVEEAGDHWDVLGVAVDHRTGVVNLGEVSVAVAVSSAHRSQAFEAARYIIDELKIRAPIWKKEFWSGGTEWARGS
ncbi:MAG: molybdenum cofactor biosynthesis protein MoaE [Gammaproteobacteria bacterium]|nr:molybdenum cofactor biosynthesis protein MoaE [Gammaproteobacteria bacterium]